MTWEQFQAGLFEKLEKNRSKIAMFRMQQVYWFINDCSQLLVNPGTPEASSALDAIKNAGNQLTSGRLTKRICTPKNPVLS